MLDRYKKGAWKSAEDLAAKGNYKKSTNRLMGHMKATGKQIQKTTASIKKSLNNENMDPKAADAMPCDCANSTDDVLPKDKNKKLIQMSKSARIIKSIYKKKGMSEEMYDQEKENKSVATYGKKPKVQQSIGADDSKAAAVMSGGTTMTGEKRDTIEIDPMMKKGNPFKR